MQHYWPAQGLTAAEELIYRQILDNTHATRETRDIAVSLKAGHMHVSKQVAGLTERSWRMEERMLAIEKHIEKRKADRPEQGGLTWVLRATWELFTAKEKISIIVLGAMVLLGQWHPKDIQLWLRGLVGSPPTASTPASGPSSSSSSASQLSVSGLLDVP